MGPLVRKIDEIKGEWSEHQKQLSALGLTNREAQKLNKEVKKLDDLNSLREKGGPFTSVEEVDAFLAGDSPYKEKQSRMRVEVRYARDTSVSFPRNHSVFRIMDTSTKPYKLLTPEQFGENLKLFLGKCTGRAYISIEEFRVAVHSLQK